MTVQIFDIFFGDGFFIDKLNLLVKCDAHYQWYHMGVKASGITGN